MLKSRTTSDSTRVLAALDNKGLNQQSAFQAFVTGGITAGASLASLLLIPGSVDTLSNEVFTLLVLLLAGIGLLLAIFGYLALLILRILHPKVSSPSPNVSSRESS